MKYFLLQSDLRYTDMPVVCNWTDKISLKDIAIGKSYHIPMRQVLPIIPNPSVVFIDVLTSPFLLLTRKCMDVISLYEPHIISKEIILYDDKNVKKEVYYLPVLPQITCLAEGSKWNLDKSVLWKGILDLDAVERFSIFQISDLQRQYTVIRLDILESLLKRGARGIHITQMETVRGGESDDRRKRNN